MKTSSLQQTTSQHGKQLHGVHNHLPSDQCVPSSEKELSPEMTPGTSVRHGEITELPLFPIPEATTAGTSSGNQSLQKVDGNAAKILKQGNAVMKSFSQTRLRHQLMSLPDKASCDTGYSSEKRLPLSLHQSHPDSALQLQSSQTQVDTQTTVAGPSRSTVVEDITYTPKKHNAVHVVDGGTNSKCIREEYNKAQTNMQASVAGPSRSQNALLEGITTKEQHIAHVGGGGMNSNSFRVGYNIAQAAMHKAVVGPPRSERALVEVEITTKEQHVGGANSKFFTVEYNNSTPRVASNDLRDALSYLTDAERARVIVAARINNTVSTSRFLGSVHEIWDEIVPKAVATETKDWVVSGQRSIATEVPAEFDGGESGTLVTAPAASEATVSVEKLPAAAQPFVAAPSDASETFGRLRDGVLTTKEGLQMEKENLVEILNKLKGSYRQYVERLAVFKHNINSQVGLNAVNPYVSTILPTLSHQFGRLKEPIEDKLRDVKRALGEEDVPCQRRREVQMQHHAPKPHAREIVPSAWRPQRGLPDRAVTVLRAWLFEHFLHPYPKDSDKLFLARQTGLTRSQVSNWFINARVRLWKPMVEEMYREEARQHVLEEMQDAREHVVGPKDAREHVEEREHVAEPQVRENVEEMQDASEHVDEMQEAREHVEEMQEAGDSVKAT